MATADPWRDRARRAVFSRLPEGLRANGDPHYVVCGGDALAYRLVNELRATRAARVTVIVPRQRRGDGPDVAAIRGVRVVQSDRLDAATFRAAGLDNASALALTAQDDVGNLHAALCAQDVNPGVRLVIRMFNTRLAQGVRRLFADCAVLSDAAMAAPAFVAASLGELTPAHFRISGRTLYVARRDDVAARDVVCGLAVVDDDGRAVAPLPADPSRADVVLAEATGRPAGTVLAARRLARQRRRRRPVALLLRGLRAVVNRRIGMALLVTLLLVVAAGVELSRSQGLGAWDTLYFTLLTVITGAEADLQVGVADQVAQVVLTVGGLALIPLITALVVDAVVNARLAVAAGQLRVPRQDHVIVVGLGNVGTRVIRQLHDLGVDVVAIDKNPGAPGAAVARELDIAVIVGDAALDETLRQASVETAQSLVVVSTDDVTNLQAGLNGRTLRHELRVVLRFFDGDFADRVQRVFDLGTSRSVSYLAAPAFAAQMTERDVLATIPLDRHVLLVAEVPVAPGSPLDGADIAKASRDGKAQVIGLIRFGEPRAHWNPPSGLRLASRDRLLVVARRSGLNWLLARAATPEAPDPQAQPNVS